MKVFKKIFLLCVLTLSTNALAAEALLINGAGATFPYPIYSKWFDEYSKKIRIFTSTTSRLDLVVEFVRHPRRLLILVRLMGR